MISYKRLYLLGQSVITEEDKVQWVGECMRECVSECVRECVSECVSEARVGQQGAHVSTNGVRSAPEQRPSPPRSCVPRGIPRNHLVPATSRDDGVNKKHSHTTTTHTLTHEYHSLTHTHTRLPLTHSLTHSLTTTTHSLTHDCHSQCKSAHSFFPDSTEL